jgi:catechol 2,3-dioxygenase-like lactoylglutathione lyase family enzyme
MAELSLVEFPADDPDRARLFWQGLLGRPLAEREAGERGAGPGDRVSLPYFTVADVGEALARVEQLGGEVIHPGERWAICRDSEGSPFGLARG